MVNQLQPHQISHLWTAIRESIRRSSTISGPKFDHYLNVILEGLLSGRHQAWMAHRRDEDSHEAYGILITSLVSNHFFGHKSLIIDHMYAFRKWDGELVNEIFESFKTFAENCGCADIVAHTNNEKAMSMATRLGFNHVTHKLQFTL